MATGGHRGSGLGGYDPSVKPFNLNDHLADISMAQEMYAASPEGRAAYEALIADLPEASITLNGHFVCADGRCGACYDCRGRKAEDMFGGVL